MKSRTTHIRAVVCNCKKKMRKTLLAVSFLSIWISLFGQPNSSSTEIPDCEGLTIKTINRLTEDFKNASLDSFDLVINEWVKQCGVSECTQRLIILKNIMENKPSLESIQTYYENSLQFSFTYRIESSRKINYGYIYSDSKAYFGYVPLRHPIDSIVMEKSRSLLEKNTLTPDERLICILFSGDIEGLEKEIKKREYNQTFTKQHLLSNYRNNSNRWLAFTLYSGIFRPISTNDVFSLSPMLGLTFSSPLKYKILVDLGIKIRFNTNDDSFNYYALGDTNYVNSDVSIFFGGIIGYKVYENEKLLLVPKFGIGLESVDTGISEKKNNSEEKTYHDVKTIHLSLGISAMTPVFRKSYLGFGVNYHYCPYQLDQNLLTTFDNNLISAELFWRF